MVQAKAGLDKPGPQQRARARRAAQQDGHPGLGRVGERLWEERAGRAVDLFPRQLPQPSPAGDNRSAARAR